MTDNDESSTFLMLRLLKGINELENRMLELKKKREIHERLLDQ